VSNWLRLSPVCVNGLNTFASDLASILAMTVVKFLFTCSSPYSITYFKLSENSSSLSNDESFVE
jgi:hypothetical protein